MDPRVEPTRKQTRQDGFGRRLLMAFYLVTEPRLYTAGVLHLPPPRRPSRAREVLGATP